jgi:hypothetical protein
VTEIVVVAVESALPAGDVGLVDVCCASYAVIVNTSLPPTAGAETLHVSGLPEQFGLDVVRFAAIDAGVPVYAVPLTLTSVMMTDCVALEMYFGERVRPFGVVLFGTVIVKRADVFGAVAFGVDDGITTGAAVSGARGAGDPPPEHAHSDADTMRGRARFDPRRNMVVIPIEWARRAW